MDSTRSIGPGDWDAYLGGTSDEEDETDDRGAISGSRSESVTYLAQARGTGTVPAITLDWYNLRTGKVETAQVDGVSYAVDGPPAQSALRRDWRKIAAVTLGGLTILALVLGLLRRTTPHLGAWLTRQRLARLASERHAFKRLLGVISARNLAQLYPALDTWADTCTGPDPRLQTLVSRALLGLGAAHYGTKKSDDTAAWQELRHAVRQARGPAEPAEAALPTLNPGA